MGQISFGFSWSLSSFDTEILGFKTAKITLFKEGDVNRSKSVSDLVKELKENDIVYAAIRINANDFLIAHELEKNNFLLVDGIIALETVLEDIDSDKFLNVKSASLIDLNQLLVIGANIFEGVSRYYHDPAIDKAKANEIYKRWIESSIKKIAADDVLIFEQDKKILGFVTLQKNGQIPLIGVINEAKGKGVGKELLFAAFARFNEWDLQRVIIDTQMTNIPALRLYQSMGFKITNSYLTFRWCKKIKA